MAYIKRELLGSAGRRPPIRRKPQLIREIRENMGKQFPGPRHGDGGNHPHGFPGRRPPRPSRIPTPHGDTMTGPVQIPDAMGMAIGAMQPDDSWANQGVAGPPIHPAFPGLPRPPFREHPADFPMEPFPGSPVFPGLEGFSPSNVDTFRPVRPPQGQRQNALIQMILEQLRSGNIRGSMMGAPPPGSYM